MTPGYTFEFPQPAPLISLNGREHWRAKARWTAMWRKAAWAAAYNAGLRDLPSCTVTLLLPVRDKRRRDPINYTPVTKACCDGMVDARLWRDDTPEFVTTTEPRLVVGAKTVVVELRPRGVELMEAQRG